MSVWNRTIKHFGEVAEGGSAKFSFVYLGDKAIKEVTTTCGCTAAQPFMNNINVVMEFGKLNGRDYNMKSSVISVKFMDDTEDKLQIHAVVFKKQDL